ncbi:MAG: hypothetical protein KF788_13070 [Piscinibacter sp.]|nr:hypothetical protein [Piscinibacter sp.]
MHRTFALLLLNAAVAGPCLAQADTPGDAPLRAELLPTSGMLGVENVRLPGGERMGLVGGSLLFDIGADWGLGPAVYGAASGRRGGLFVGGVELQRRWAISRGWSLAAGLFAGGGGGAGAPVGNGLMLRPALTLLTDLGPSLQAGLSWSHVRFPSGDIGSSQLGLTLAWRQEFRHYVGGAPGAPVQSSQSSGLGFDRISATATRYRFSDGSDRRIGLAGARLERRSGLDGLVWGLEAAGAAAGDAAGYMEILGTAGASVALLPDPSWRVGLRVAAGLGGGGAVPTEGGLLGKAALGTEFSPWPGWSLGGEIGVVRGANSPLRARTAQVWLGVELEPGLDGRPNATGRVVRSEWTAALQHHTRVPRRDRTTGSLDTIGLKLTRALGEHLYVTGQAHSAFGGGAGAYSVGLVGVGLATTPGRPRRFGVELLAGAAGGGGVQTGGGALYQGVAWAKLAGGPDSEWRVGLGAARARRDGTTSPVVELSWTRAFGLAGR